jgi:hypothetical protein
MPLATGAGWGRMRIEFYRVFYWAGIGAAALWTVYSAYSAITFS